MRYITRWGLMRNTFSENIQEHSHMVAVLAHALALIRRDILGGEADPERCATAALFHDVPEILTGDLPTPVKYFNPEIKDAYKQVERVSGEKLLQMLPPALQPSYAPFVLESDPATGALVKAAEISSQLILNVSRSSRRATWNLSPPQSRPGGRWTRCQLPEVDWFLANCLPAFQLNLDELE